ncbi:uncharacterized protein PHALS_15356 [Plasmopara halstedii]|uniref:Uncharacterized protein n=1 Tax=Plasmopara halstedii TaxID=4781 RepID=A0A0P1ADY4_PLAHL|nr:uncharacterized protein PHALS_15356 [Plasmopara halstedii]CEG39111.1 hypothetical protein PHALS_15356 [Plasmopara halstedii]|eukprot:XP_024575480.1 hypothetical protein PHALS_15356 [Plasmopara halstedii]
MCTRCVYCDVNNVHTELRAPESLILKAEDNELVSIQKSTTFKILMPMCDQTTDGNLFTIT